MSREWVKQIEAIRFDVGERIDTPIEIDYSRHIFLGMSSPTGRVSCKHCGRYVSGFVQVDGGYACNIPHALKVLEEGKT